LIGGGKQVEARKGEIVAQISISNAGDLHPLNGLAERLIGIAGAKHGH